ncbi:MAG: kinase/pyrophosphorylase [Candidatus Accumulibacter sp.]|jgi:regulator of PEP synthase PpsR (kinase-PPPase family)|nr:kinase/pyrophosphorylase [Accumulibacter sp.]
MSSSEQISRTIFYISDGTGITAETLGLSLLTQFNDIRFKTVRLPFVDTLEKVHDCRDRLQKAFEQDGFRPIVFSTLVNPEFNQIFGETNSLCLNFFDIFIAPLETELGIKRSEKVGRTHGLTNNADYERRINAINYTLSHDDGITDHGLEEADVILVGVSRCGKTPTSIYLAMQFGVRAANFPLIPEDFENRRFPEALTRHKEKLFGLTIQPERLTQIRTERRPNSKYASPENCHYEIREAEKMMRQQGIHWLDSSSKSIEEISATIIQEIKLLDNQEE